MIKPEDVTIIIPHLGKTKEQRYALKNCVQSLYETTSSKVIIVVNGIDDNTEISTQGKPDRIKLMMIEEQGQCKAVNAAIATTNTPWVFITNDDMMYAPGWFERLVSPPPDLTIEEYSRLQPLLCLSPKLVEPRPGAPTFEVMFAGGAGGDFDREKWLGYAKEYFESGDGVLRTGFNFPVLIKRELWDVVGGYDINYDPWGSNGDSDLQYKIMLAGIQPMQVGRCIVYHFSQTSGTFEPKNDSFRFRNYAYFKEKWGFDRTDNRIWESDFEIPDKERIYRPYWEGFFNK